MFHWYSPMHPGRSQFLVHISRHSSGHHWRALMQCVSLFITHSTSLNTHFCVRFHMFIPNLVYQYNPKEMYKILWEQTTSYLHNIEEALLTESVFFSEEFVFWISTSYVSSNNLLTCWCLSQKKTMYIINYIIWWNRKQYSVIYQNYK